LDWVFAFFEERVIASDFTISWRNCFPLEQTIRGLKKERVTVLENLNGEIRIWGNNRLLKFREITGGYPSANETAKTIPQKNHTKTLETACRQPLKKT